MNEYAMDEARATFNAFEALTKECGETEEYALGWLARQMEHMIKQMDSGDAFDYIVSLKCYLPACETINEVGKHLGVQE